MEGLRRNKFSVLIGGPHSISRVPPRSLYFKHNVLLATCLFTIAQFRGLDFISRNGSDKPAGRLSLFDLDEFEWVATVRTPLLSRGGVASGAGVV